MDRPAGAQVGSVVTAGLLDIGEVVRASGVPVSTLHLWERKGLLVPADRAGLRRQYAPEVLNRIALIVVSQRAGFTLAEIAELLAHDAFSGGKQLLATKLEELREHRRALDAAILGLEHALACPHEAPTECANFQRLLSGVLPVRESAKR